MGRDMNSDITLAIKRYFKLEGISYEEAARRLGQSRQSVANRLRCGGFTSRSVASWCRAFGFNERFLLNGLGTLTDEDSFEKHYYRKLHEVLVENKALKKKIRRLESQKQMPSV